LGSLGYSYPLIFGFRYHALLQRKVRATSQEEVSNVIMKAKTNAVDISPFLEI
jgi:hypothetical protein